MKKIKNLFKPQVLLLLLATIIFAVLVATSYANYKKTTAYYSEKVVGEIIEVEKIKENYISFFDTINTKITYKVIYEYEWQGETYQTEVNKGLGLFLNYFEKGTKAICYINAENPSDAVINVSDPVKPFIVLFFAFLMGFMLVAIYCLFDNDNEKEIEAICTCPYCKSEKVGVKDVVGDTNRKIWAYCPICGRTSKEREVPLETSDDEIIELATVEWRNREKKLSLEELEALYLTQYTMEDNEEVVGDDVMHFIAWCREKA